ncbi:beta-N-acetylhexosaminidase [Sphingomonas sp. RG327]|jgi:beta-N-acetylhexosaminidase|uniref:beta-N-acetylhexosaminidase n=1 Tax=Sphingomonas anseongensis TaxID=2908207 RepID=A0ABT0REX8_9SPHN|nr:beta-N-acetylhexosaminidase [Sphingomonas anseongensis]MCL6678837.1 beta-N-acetylhexosaminidase [Sphingomonas anseongensis]
MQAAIYGLAGDVLTDDERDFFRDAEPAAYILFKRNCIDPQQLRALTEELRGLAGRADLPILIDQEGGRVARMQPPEWPRFPPSWAFADLYSKAPTSAIEATMANARALALMLRDCGVNVDCLPLLDVRQEGADDIIGDRALGAEPMQVSALGRAVLDGFASAGVVGVVKHIPGHGRALCDSHKELPIVEAGEDELAVDLEPFAKLNWAPMGMMAHVVYTAWDEERPASLSPVVIRDIVRGRIGFDGWLMSDDIGMEALQGDFGARAAGVIAAGCDAALHCSGKMDEMVAVAAAAPRMTSEGEERLRQAMVIASDPADGPGFEELIAKRDELLALV